MARTVPHYHGHRKRLKQRYCSGAIDAWQDYEVLELLLTYALPRKDTKPIAKKLIGVFSHLGGVLEAERKELEKLCGISKHSSILLTLVKDIARRYQKSEMAGKDLVSSPETAFSYLSTMLKSCKNEEMHALFLDAANRLIETEKVHSGTVNKSAVYPRMIAERALHHHAAGVIVAHNHPGGSPHPSGDDITATRAIQAALTVLDISLLDHILIAGNGYFSWKEKGLL